MNKNNFEFVKEVGKRFGYEINGFYSDKQRRDWFDTLLPKYICEECKKEITMSFKQLKDYCLLVSSEYEKGNFKGLCPECTNKWKERIQKSGPKGYNIKYMSIDELKEI